MLRNRYERNPNSNESVRVFDSSSKKLLTELATLYGDSQAIEDLKRSNFEKEPQAPEDRLIGLYNLNLSMFRDLSWRGSVLLEPSEEQDDKHLSSRPTMSLQIKWTHSETRKDTIVSELISVQIPTIGISLVDNSNRLESTTEVTYLGTRDVVATYVVFERWVREYYFFHVFVMSLKLQSNAQSIVTKTPTPTQVRTFRRRTQDVQTVDTRCGYGQPISRRTLSLGHVTHKSTCQGENGESSTLAVCVRGSDATLVSCHMFQRYSCQYWRHVLDSGQ